MARSTPHPSVADSLDLGATSGRSRATLLLVSLRPEQWTKNVFVFAGVIFAGQLDQPDRVLAAAETFIVFCALSSAVYLFNDVADRDADAHHPLKSLRPIASGELSAALAIGVATLLGGAGMLAAVLITPLLGVVAASYVGLLVLYSVALKHFVIVDVLTISAGFVLRAVAGTVAIDVSISQWLLVCTTLLALFLALSKRRHELVFLSNGAVSHRRILDEYSPHLLDQMVSVVTASTLVAYTSYATSDATAELLGTDRMAGTIPFVLYGIFRYLYLVHQKQVGGSPAALVMGDRPLFVCLMLWVAVVVALLYTPLGG